MKSILYNFISRIFIVLVLFFISSSIFSQNNSIKLTTNSNKALKYFIEGRDLLENSANEMAEQKLNEAIKLDPNFLMAHVYMGILKNDSMEFQESRQKIKDGLIEVSPGEKIFIDYAESYINKDVYKMEQAISKLIGMFPNDPRIHNYLGITNYYSSKFDIAQNYFNNAIEIDKKMAVTYNMLGYCYMRLEKNELAEEMFKQYIQLKPELANPYDSYADFLMKQERYTEAIENFEKSLSIRPAFWNSLNLLGQLYLNEKNYEKARYYFKRITEIPETRENKFNAMFMLAYVDILEGKINDAINTFNWIIVEAITQNYKQGKANALAQKGFLLSETGKIEEGRKFMNDAIQEVENNKIKCLNPECSVWKIFLLSNLGQLEEAKIELDNMHDAVFEARTLEAYNLWFTSEGYINIQSKKFDKAIKSLKKGAENSFTWYNLANVLAENGNKEEAKAYFNKIIDAREFDIFRAVYLKKAEIELGKL